MLITELDVIGNNIYKLRKRQGLTQAETAEKAGISDRAFAEIERGNVNMRVETLLQICNALSVTPNQILIDDLTPDYLNKFNNQDQLDKSALLDALEKNPEKMQTAVLQFINTITNPDF